VTHVQVFDSDARSEFFRISGTWVIFTASIILKPEAMVGWWNMVCFKYACVPDVEVDVEVKKNTRVLAL